MMKKAYKYFIAVALTAAIAGCKGIYEDGTEMASDRKSQVKSVALSELEAKTEKGEAFTLIDVRQAEDFVVESIPGSVNIPRGVLEFQISDSTYWESQYMFPPAKDEEIIVYSDDGSLGTMAAIALKQIGYNNVSNLQGGFRSFNSNPGESAAPQASSGCGG